MGFGKIIKIIDDMIANLKEEQADDDGKKEFCTAQLDAADDKKESLERTVFDLEARARASRRPSSLLRARSMPSEFPRRAQDTPTLNSNIGC